MLRTWLLSRESSLYIPFNTSAEETCSEDSSRLLMKLLPARPCRQKGAGLVHVVRGTDWWTGGGKVSTCTEKVQTVHNRETG